MSAHIQERLVIQKTLSKVFLTRIPKLKNLGTALLLPVFLLAAATSGRCEQSSFVFATTNLAPVVTETGDGYLDRIFNEVFARLGYTYRFEAMPGARALAGANDGTFDGDTARVANAVKDYPNLIRVPEPVISVMFAAVTLKDEIKISKVSDLNGHSVGYVRGWKFFEKLLARHETVEVVRTAEMLMRMLAEGRVDVAFLSVAPALHIADEMGIDSLVVTELRFKKELFVHLNLKHADLVPLMDATLKAMKADRSYGEIMADYTPEGH